MKVNLQAIKLHRMCLACEDEIRATFVGGKPCGGTLVLPSAVVCWVPTSALPLTACLACMLSYNQRICPPSSFDSISIFLSQPSILFTSFSHQKSFHLIHRYVVIASIRLSPPFSPFRDLGRCPSIKPPPRMSCCHCSTKGSEAT